MKTHLFFKNIKKISETEFEIELDWTVTVSFKIKREILKIIEEIAKKQGRTTSDIIREALKEEINEIKNLGTGRVVSFRIKENQLRDIDELARQHKVTRTDIIHSKLAKYLEKEGVVIG
jgi:predicted transcriptional regulator